MSSSNDQARATTDTELNDDLVCEYLKDNSDFLQRYPDLLDYLQVPHASGSAVSLVEKQVSVLRERNVDMRHRLNALTGNARDNDKLYEQTRALILQLLEASSLAQLCQTFIDGMTTGFAVEHVSIILFTNGKSVAGCRTDSLEQAKHAIGPLLRGNKAVCGALREEELRYLFADGGQIGSAALMPLSKGDSLGLIAVGSSDANRYHSAMGTLFLSHIADVIVRLLPRLTAGDG